MTTHDDSHRACDNHDDLYDHCWECCSDCQADCPEPI